MAAHGSQARADGQRRVLDVLLGLPLPVFGLAFGREWFVEVAAEPGNPVRDDLFASLRARPRETKRG